MSELAYSIRLPYIYVWGQKRSALLYVQAEEVQETEGEYYQHVAVNCDKREAWGVCDGAVFSYAAPTEAVYQTLDEICGIVATTPLVVCCQTRQEERFYRIRDGETEDIGHFNNPRLFFGRLSVARNNWAVVATRGLDKEQRMGVVTVAENRVELHRFPRGARVYSPASCVPQASLFTSSVCQVVGINGKTIGVMRAERGSVMDAVAAADRDTAIACLSIARQSGSPLKTVCLFSRPPSFSSAQPLFVGVIAPQENLAGLMVESPYAYLATLDEKKRAITIHVLHAGRGYLHSVLLPLALPLRPVVCTVPGLDIAKEVGKMGGTEERWAYFSCPAATASGAKIERTLAAGICLLPEIEFVFAPPDVWNSATSQYDRGKAK